MSPLSLDPLHLPKWTFVSSLHLLQPFPTLTLLPIRLAQTHPHRPTAPSSTAVALARTHLPDCRRRAPDSWHRRSLADACPAGLFNLIGHHPPPPFPLISLSHNQMSRRTADAVACVLASVPLAPLYATTVRFIAVCPQHPNLRHLLLSTQPTLDSPSGPKLLVVGGCAVDSAP